MRVNRGMLNNCIMKDIPASRIGIMIWIEIDRRRGIDARMGRGAGRPNPNIGTGTKTAIRSGITIMEGAMGNETVIEIGIGIRTGIGIGTGIGIDASRRRTPNAMAVPQTKMTTWREANGARSR